MHARLQGEPVSERRRAGRRAVARFGIGRQIPQHSEDLMHWTYEPAMEQGVFPHEGGYTNDPRDPGGPTNWGITIYDARKYWKPTATAADVKAMPKSVAEAIYWPHYAVPLCYDDLPAGADYAALDYGINSGVSRGAKVMQHEQCRRRHWPGNACRRRPARPGGARQCDL
jgi:hypothetical protein